MKELNMTGTAYPGDAVAGVPIYAATQGRTALAAAMGGATTARPLGGFSGVRPGTAATIATATSTTWTITPFGGYIDLESPGTTGGYFFSFQANETGSVTAAAGSARVDLLYVQVADSNTSDGSGLSPRVVTGYQVGVAGSGIPTLTVPRAFVIAQINVPASGGGSPSMTWVAPYTVAAGATFPFLTQAQLTATTGTQIGQLAEVFADSTAGNNGTYRWNGTAWKNWQSDWIAYTPTIAGLTLGNGTSTWAYKFVAGGVSVVGGVVLGSTSAVSGAFDFSLPVTRAALVHPYEPVQGAAALYDTSAGTPYIVGVAAAAASVTTAHFYPHNSGPVTTAINASNPYVWATGDAFSAEFTYRAA